MQLSRTDVVAPARQLRTAGHDAGLARDVLLPAARALAPNWLSGNRREAGAVLAHVTGSGLEASEIVTALSRILKKVSLAMKNIS